jgi:thiosulfate/3-mercaptopyruvate sulfurtransferase
MTSTIVSVDWLYKNLDLPNLIILDASLKENQAKTLSDFENLRIPNARFFDLKTAFSDQNNPLPNSLPSPSQFEDEARKIGISKNSFLVVYDNLGIYSSPRAWWIFQVMGFTNIAVLDGGLPQWIKHNYPVETIPENEIYNLGDFKVDFQKELVKTKHQVERNIIDQKYLIVDARIENRYNGIVKETRAGLQSGHISKALNIPYTSVLHNNTFLQPEELKTVLKPSSQPIIVYCGSGVTACIIVLAYALIESDNCSVYDGSWAEWGLKKNI